MSDEGGLRPLNGYSNPALKTALQTAIQSCDLGRKAPATRGMIVCVLSRLISGAVFSVLISAPVLAQAPSSALDLQGQSVTLQAFPGEVLVLIFVASDCPISNRYLPEIEAIDEEFVGRPVKLELVYPNPTETATGIRSLLADYHLRLTALRDPAQALVAAAGAHVTPEAAVFLPAGKGRRREVYRGRIDNRYISFGHEKPQATEHELRDAIRAALDGHPVHQAGGPPLGCAILPPSAAQP